MKILLSVTQGEGSRARRFLAQGIRQAEEALQRKTRGVEKAAYVSVVCPQKMEPTMRAEEVHQKAKLTIKSGTRREV